MDSEDIEPSFLCVLDLACDLREGETFFTGILRSEALLCKFEEELHRLGMKFSVKCRSKRITPGSTKSKRVLFEYKSGHKVPFLGHPFTIEDTLYKDCHLGGRERSSEQGSNGDHHPEQLAKCRITKKKGCEATFVIKKLHVYEDIEVAREEDRLKNFANKEAALRKVKSGDYTTSCWYCFQITKPEYHNHDFGEATQRCQTIHPQLVDKIKELVRDGVRKVENIKNILDEYVKSDVLKDALVRPTTSNTSFFPSIKAVRNAVCRAIQSEKYSKIDQEPIAERVKDWHRDHVFYRPYVTLLDKEGTDVESDVPERYTVTFLLVHQTPWQKEMLKKYGDVCILDAVYRTLGYGLPLFFIVMKTNLGYVVVATFVVQFETEAAISEALHLIRSWNPRWSPRYVLSGNVQVELDVLTNVFPESEIYICDFHRQQLWLRWLNKNGNVTSAASETLFHLWQKLATSPTKEAFEATVWEMKHSRVWIESKKVQNYFSGQWMPVEEKWVQYYYPFDYEFHINVNNGAETLEKFLRHPFLVHHINKTVGNLLGVVIDHYLPEQLRTYVHGNVELSSGFEKQVEEIPEWLHDRPHGFVRHVLTRWSSASNEFHHIEHDENVFAVRSSSEDYPEEAWCSVPSYRVDLTQPSCTCYDFRKWFFPCKHICAIIIFVPGITIEHFPSHYLNSPYLNIDNSFLYDFTMACDNAEPLQAVTLPGEAVEGSDHSYQLQHAESVLEAHDLPSSLASKAATCRNILQEMHDLTYSIGSPLKLEQIIMKLQPILNDMKDETVQGPDLLLTNILKKRDLALSHEELANKKNKANVPSYLHND